MSSDRSAGSGSFLLALLLFCVAAPIAVMLLIAALLLGISQWLGSLVWSTLLLGGLFLLVAAALWLLAIREPVRQIKARIDTVYDVARLFKQGYDWVAAKVDFFVRLRNELFRPE